MDGLIQFLTDMPFWAWLALAALLLLVELVTGTTFVLWPAIAALILGVITTVQLDGQWATQWILFSGLTVALGVVGRPYAERWINTAKSDRPGLNRFGTRWVGRRGVVSAAFASGRGRVRLGDTEWQARLPGEAADALAEGTAIEVIETDGATMVVAALPSDG